MWYFCRTSLVYHTSVWCEATNVKIWKLYPWICLLKELTCSFTTIITRLRQRCIFYDKLNFASVQRAFFIFFYLVFSWYYFGCYSFWCRWWGLAFMLNFKCTFLRECSLCILWRKIYGFLCFLITKYSMVFLLHLNNTTFSLLLRFHDFVIFYHLKFFFMS